MSTRTSGWSWVSTTSPTRLRRWWSGWTALRAARAARTATATPSLVSTTRWGATCSPPLRRSSDVQRHGCGGLWPPQPERPARSRGVGRHVGAREALRHARRAARVEIDADVVDAGARERGAVGAAQHLEAPRGAQPRVRAHDPGGGAHPIAGARRAQVVDLDALRGHAAPQPQALRQRHAERGGM